MDIIVLCGGLGGERDVSITSGTGVARALRERGHRAVLLDIFLGYDGDVSDPEHIFSLPQTDLDYHVSEDVPDIEALRKSRRGDALIGPGVLALCRAADIVFLALHGDDGENGRVQAMLDVHGIKYTGCGYLGSALAMNKGLSKKLFADAGILAPAGITVSKGARAGSVGFPCVVKPCSGGSSVGTSIANTAEEYEEALDLAFKYENDVIVEQYVKGRELTVGVLDGKAMPIVEIIPKSGFYDYKNKYQAGMTEEICPAKLDEETALRLSETALRVGKALMLDSYYRADFLLDSDGNIYCLEANTLPGMTPTSLIPQMAAELGIGFGELCEKIIEDSMRKYR